MYKGYLTDYEGKNEYHLSDFNTVEEALIYILNSIDIDVVTYLIVFTRSNNVLKAFNVKGLHFANYIIKEGH